MGYIEKNPVPGETLAYRTGCYWVVMFWPLVGGAVLGFVGFAFFAGGWMATRNGGRYEGAMVWGALALLGAVALIGGGVIRRFATEVAVSNRRVLIKTGLLSRRSIEAYISEANGSYRFSGLDPNVDFEIHTEYKKAKSARRSISSFDDRRDIEINLIINTK